MMDVSPDTSVADVKAELAGLGLSIDPSTELTYRERPRNEPGMIVVVDRIGDIDGLPDYCVHGYATCAACRQFCYLGNKTYEAAMNGAQPVCLPCANMLIPPTHAQAGHLKDNLRADGPHHD